ncbi:Ribosomal RNA-processing protein 7 [Scheffersomyces spartinae]|uniref:Ribosomal RNA-processing protein 7 n=1 Tax=Scheffersomyces spartinae TaxID=45513 RepID=A0A9P8AJI9_9ASCO|nr:Ribosomal RNA-processing protein 7 [Scheffersomyces spartinae]KAG7195495.1 Ribosomal RNA-processing protein 7 [Scheffersomyces spartinae]
MVSTEIKGFHILPVKFSGSSADHYIFFRKHETREQKNTSRAIFFFNLPICTTGAVVKKYLQQVALGATMELFTASILTECPEDVWLDMTRLTSDLELNGLKDEGGGSKLPRNCGIVTFIDKAAFQLAFTALKALSSLANVTEWPLNDLGSKFFRSCLKKQILDPVELAQTIAQSVVDFDRAEAESIEQLQNQTQLVDEDGFTMVVGTHRKTKAGILGKQKLAASVEVEKAKDKLKKKEKDDFYRFQLRQKKKDEMNDLLMKFRQDQEKVRLMKEKKRFRPY